ncbi:MAG TPA: FAD:protein FMN transferase, partial [Polyangiales bacterium]|nr:FAD:protein FMN transferase [Polyangiales bacterium]
MRSECIAAARRIGPAVVCIAVWIALSACGKRSGEAAVEAPMTSNASAQAAAATPSTAPPPPSAATGSAPSEPPLLAVQRTREMMGTIIQMTIVGLPEERAAPALSAAMAEMSRLEGLLSEWRDDSEISRLARGELELTSTSTEVREVLDFCERLKSTSRGAFDVAFAAAAADLDAPGRRAIDPTGVVKGWAVDRAGELLGAMGVTHAAINAGGDILVRGDRPWRIGIQHPWERDKTAQIVAVTNGAIATSGNYERGDHVVDARTGRPAIGLTAVSVIASNLALADGYATTALALGDEGMGWLATRPDVVAIGITDDRRVVK